MLAACGVDPAGPDADPRLTDPDAPPPPAGPWFKNPEPFITRDDKGLESRLESLDGLTTPNRLFFVRNNSVNWDVDTADWTLSVEGDAISDPLQLTYQDIRNLPTYTLISYLECAGNHRAMFDLGQRSARIRNPMDDGSRRQCRMGRRLAPRRTNPGRHSRQCSQPPTMAPETPNPTRYR